MTTTRDRLREVGKWRTVPLTPEAHRALVLYVRGQAKPGEEYDIGERMAVEASRMVLAGIERGTPDLTVEGVPVHVTDVPEEMAPCGQCPIGTPPHHHEAPAACICSPGFIGGFGVIHADDCPVRPHAEDAPPCPRCTMAPPGGDCAARRCKVAR